jgi:hypothetical protein
LKFRVVCITECRVKGLKPPALCQPNTSNIACCEWVMWLLLFSGKTNLGNRINGKKKSMRDKIISHARKPITITKAICHRKERVFHH